MSDPYSTHLPVLRALGEALRIEWVLELGAGLYSTPLFLDQRVYPDLKLLVSDEPDASWRLRVTNHVMEQIGSAERWVITSAYFESIIADLDAYDLIFVDNGQMITERVAYIQAIASAAPRAIVVIHDYENLPYQQAAAQLKHVHIFTQEKPWTAVLWNGQRPDLERFVERMGAGV